MSVCLSLSSIGDNGQFEPCVRSRSKCIQLGCRESSCLSTVADLNSDPYPTGESCCASIAVLRHPLNFLITQRFLFAASSVSLKLNRGCDGFAHGSLTMMRMMLVMF